MCHEMQPDEMQPEMSEFLDAFLTQNEITVRVTEVQNQVTFYLGDYIYVRMDTILSPIPATPIDEVEHIEPFRIVAVATKTPLTQPDAHDWYRIHDLTSVEKKVMAVHMRKLNIAYEKRMKHMRDMDSKKSRQHIIAFRKGCSYVPKAPSDPLRYLHYGEENVKRSGWYFFDENWLELHGPYEDEEYATAALNEYARNL